MPAPALGARRRTPAHTLLCAHACARAHIRPPLSGVSQVSQAAHGGRNDLEIRRGAVGTRGGTQCDAVTPPRPLCRASRRESRARTTSTYPPPPVGTPAPVSARVRVRVRKGVQGRAGKGADGRGHRRKRHMGHNGRECFIAAHHRPGVYMQAARHVLPAGTGLLPGATGIGFSPPACGVFSATGGGLCRRGGESPANRKKTGKTGLRRFGARKRGVLARACGRAARECRQRGGGRTCANVCARAKKNSQLFGI